MSGTVDDSGTVAATKSEFGIQRHQEVAELLPKRRDFMTLTIDRQKISGVTVEVDRTGDTHPVGFFQLSGQPV